MSNTLSKIIMFTAGAAIGSIVTWKIVSDKYEARLKKELEIMYGEVDNTEESDGEEDPEEPTEEEKAEYERIIAGCNYSTYAKKELEEKEEKDMNDAPHLIDQDEWDDSEYEQDTLYCFADGVIANEMEEEIENADELIGPDAARWLYESGNDWIYVRNDRLETDYEILRDIRRYSEVD